MQNNGNLHFQRAIHPGEIQKEKVEYRGFKQTMLAERIDLSYKMLSDILNCRRPLTATTAMLFEAAPGVNAGLLMRMQLDYNMQTTQQDKSFIQRLERIRRVAAMFCPPNTTKGDRFPGRLLLLTKNHIFSLFTCHPPPKMGNAQAYK